jgi:hypothetical protein
MDNHDSYSDPVGGDYRGVEQGAKPFFRSLLGSAKRSRGKESATCA